MADDFEGDEVALHRAIAAAPDDAAPWLVYADWLQDHGRDAEAEAVRKSLSVFQYMVQAGLRPAYVMSLIAPPEPASTVGPPVEMRGRSLTRLTPRPYPPERASGGLDSGAPSRYVPVCLVLLALVGLSQLAIWPTRPERPPAPSADDLGLTRPAQNEVARLAGTHPITQTPPAKPVRGPGEFRPANIQPRPGQLVWELGQRLGHTFRSGDERVPLTLTFRENGGIEIHLVDQAGGVVGVRGTWWADERGTLNVVGATEGPGPWRLKPNAANDSYELEHDGLKQVFVPTKLPPDG